MIQQHNYSHILPFIWVHLSSIFWMLLLLYCLHQGYHQCNRTLRIEHQSWSSVQWLSHNFSHPLQYPIYCKYLQLWGLDHLDILVVMFTPCPALHTLTPQNLVHPLIDGYFDYPGLHKLWYPWGFVLAPDETIYRVDINSTRYWGSI